MKFLLYIAPLFLFVAALFGVSINSMLTPISVTEVSPNKPIPYIADVTIPDICLSHCRIDKALLIFDTDSLTTRTSYKIRLASDALPPIPRYHRDLLNLLILHPSVQFKSTVNIKILISKKEF